MPPRISRSRMLHITSRDLFAAMDLDRPGLGAARRPAGNRAWKAAYEAWADHFRRRPAPVSMPSTTGQQAGVAAVERAERVVEHEIQGWHTLTYKFGERVDFNAEWGRSGKYGVHYWGWSEPLRLAFEQTGDRRYAECFDDLFNQWYEQRDQIDNPVPPTDVIFYELGVGGRTPRLIDHYFAYRDADVLRWRTHERLLKTILGGCRWLYLLESKEGYRGGNWQMCGSWCLVYAGGLFPEFREAADWVEEGVRRLVEHVERDFYDDGCHYERASGYGTWCTRMSEDLLRFSALNPHVDVPADLRQRVVGMYDWFLSTATPRGESQGFNDGGFGAMDDTLSRGAAFTGDGRYLWPVRDRIRSVDGIRPRQPDYTSIDQRPSGFAVMRSGWGRDDRYMIINYGPWGGGHAHNDLLDFGLYAWGQPLAIEANRWGPYDNPLDQYFRSPQAHNQVVVNDAPLDREHFRGEDVYWAAGEAIDCFGARHRGYEESCGVVLQRRITFVKPDYFLVSDTVLEGPQHQSYTWYLHSPHKWRGGKSRLLTAGLPGLQVVPARASEIRHLRRGTAYEARDGAPGDYPNRYWVGLQKWVGVEGVSAVTYDVALVPFRRSPAKVRVSRLPAEVDGAAARPEIARAVCIERGQRTDLVVYGADADTVTTCGALEFRGRLCVLSRRGKRPVRVAVLDGGRVRYDGSSLLPSQREGLAERRLAAAR